MGFIQETWNGLKQRFNSNKDGSYTPLFDMNVFDPIGSHTSTYVTGTASTLSVPTGTNPSKLLIQALNQNIRITLDGTTPTTSLGFQIKAGDPAVLIGISQYTIVKVREEASAAIIEYEWGT